MMSEVLEKTKLYHLNINHINSKNKCDLHENNLKKQGN